MKHLLKALLLIALSVPAAAQEDIKLGGRFERDADIHSYAYDILDKLNQLSIAVNREYCGFIYFDLNGELTATQAEKGTIDGCWLTEPADASEIFASYHTHAAFDPAYLNEYPSQVDMEGDFGSNRHGYIATPGGRLWFVDNDKRVARQLCGYRCMFFDNRYVEGAQDRPKQELDLPRLIAVFNQ